MLEKVPLFLDPSVMFPIFVIALDSLAQSQDDVIESVGGIDKKLSCVSPRTARD